MSYRLLEEHFRRVSHLEHATAMLQWDEAVLMPTAAGEARADAVASLGVMTHELLTRPVVQDWLNDAESESLDEWQRANVREIRHQTLRASALEPSLVEQSSIAQLRCEQAWRQYRARNDWDSFAPLLERVVGLKRRMAEAWGAALGVSPYDALIDEYEPGAKSESIAESFAELGAFLPDFTRAVVERQRSRGDGALGHSDVVQPRGPFPVRAQRRLGIELMEAVGFDVTRGRLDVSHHPFCGGVPQDVRITTRYDENDFTTSLMGVLHEAGHAKYEQGLPARWATQPVGKARGMAAHEGQSLLQEMQICRSREFLEFAAPRINEAFGDLARGQPQAFSVDNLYALYCRVRPGLIRVDADEVTYASHVILRFEIERALVAGAVEVADIPELWNRRMVELLGVDPGTNYADGCMQDVHWPSGSFGYFPVYALGAMAAAQIFAAMRREIPGGVALISRGDFSEINDWLRRKIWSQGCRYAPDELMVAATGEPLGMRCFREHLQQRFGQ